MWKLADVPPLPKVPTICDFVKDLRPTSLIMTSTLSKVAEGIVIEKKLKAIILSSIDPRQFGFIPGSSTTFALISMLHHWLSATNRNGSTVRATLLGRFPFVRTGRPERTGSHRCKWKGQGRPARFLMRSLRGIHARADVNNMADVATRVCSIPPTFFLDFLSPEEDTLFVNDAEDEVLFFSISCIFSFVLCLCQRGRLFPGVGKSIVLCSLLSTSQVFPRSLVLQ